MQRTPSLAGSKVLFGAKPFHEDLDAVDAPVEGCQVHQGQSAGQTEEERDGVKMRFRVKMKFEIKMRFGAKKKSRKKMRLAI